MEHGGAEGRIPVLNVHPGSFLAEDAPEIALPVIAGDDLPYAGHLPLRDGFYRNIVLHRFILSQPHKGCIQKPQPPLRFLRLRLKLGFLQQEGPLQGRPVLPASQEIPDGGVGEAHILQRPYPVCRRQLAFLIVAVAGEGVDGLRGQKPGLVIDPQQADAGPGQF